MTLTRTPLTRFFVVFSALVAVFGSGVNIALASDLPVFKAEDVFEMLAATLGKRHRNGLADRERVAWWWSIAAGCGHGAALPW